MSETVLSKGIMFGDCFTPGCTESGTTVKGIAGQANMWGPDANHQHRCANCHTLIRGVLETALSYVILDTGLDRGQAGQDPTFVNVGKQILSYSLDQLKGTRL